MNALWAYLQDLSQTALQILLRDETIEVLVKALESLGHCELLLDDPLFNLVNRVLLPVKVVLNCLLLNVLKSQNI